MAFPQDVLGIKVELFYDQQWNPISPMSDVRGVGAADGEITIGMRGQPDESSGITTSIADLAINNRNGRYSPRNINSDLYGKLGPNTPLRISVDLMSSLADVEDDFSTDGTDGWPTADSGHVWTVSGTASDYFTSGGLAYHRHAAVSTEHRSALNGLLVTDFNFELRGVALEAQPTGGPVYVRVYGRVGNGGDDWVSAILTFNTDTTVDLSVESSLSNVLTTSVSTEIPSVVATDTISLRFQARGRTIRARAWETGTTEPATWLHSEETTTLTPGTVAVTSELDAAVSNVLPFDVTFAEVFASLGIIVHVGEVAEWPKKWDSTGNDVWTPLKSCGITRRLIQGELPLGSALSRFLTRLDLVGYWSFEDLEGDTASAYPTMPSALEGGAPLIKVEGATSAYADVEWDGEDSLVGSGKLPVVSSSVDATGQLSYSEAILGGSAVDADEFSLAFWMRSTPKDEYSAFATRIKAGLFVANSTLYITEITAQTEIDVSGDPVITLSAYGLDGANGILFDISGSVPWEDRWRLIRLHVYTNSPGSGIAEILADGVFVTFDSFVVADTVGHPNEVFGYQYISESSNLDVASGHFAVATGTGVGTDALEANEATHLEAGAAYQGELAVTRAIRICAEEGLTLEVITDDDDPGTPLGPQKSINIVDMLTEIVRADDGVLYELRDDRGYGFRTRYSMLGTGSQLTLDYSNADLSDVPEATDDDQRTVNRFTAKLKYNTTGTATPVTVTKTTGPMSISDPTDDPPGVGLYGEGSSFNLDSFDQLADYAGWRVHLGTWDETRWPGIAVALHRQQFSGDLAKLTAAAFLDVSEIFTIINTPQWISPESVVLQVRAVKVFLSNFNWGIDWVTLPGRAWTEVGQVSSAEYGRVDTEGCVLMSGVDSDDTTLYAYTAESDLPFTMVNWIEHVGELNYNGAGGIDFRLNPPSRAGGSGGERVRALADPEITDTFTRSGQLSGSNADSGQTWVNTAGTAADATTAGTQAVFTHPSANTQLHQTIPGADVDLSVLVDVEFSVTSTSGGDLSAWVILRQSDANNYYAAVLTLPSSGATTVTLTVVKVIGGVQTTISSASAPVTESTLNVTRFRVRVGTVHRTIRAKFWDAESPGNVEPDWQIILYSAANQLQTGTDVALRSIRATGNATANATVYFDNLTVIKPKIMPSYYDKFNRTVTDGLGSANVGGAWTLTGTAADFDVAPNAATTVHPAAGDIRQAELQSIDLLDCCVSLVWTCPTPTGDFLAPGNIILRGGGTAELLISLLVTTSSTAIIELYGQSGFIASTGAIAGVTHSAATEFRIKAAVEGQTVMAKVWRTGLPEPRKWTITATDPTTPDSGWVGWLNERPSGNTNVNATFTIADFRVENPQTIEVQRGMDGVSRAWDADTDIRLWTPIRLGR